MLKSLASRLWLLGSVVSLIALAGCGAGTTAVTGAGGSLAMRGSIHGGQQPVKQSKVKLFAVGQGGNGSPATSMLVNDVASGDDGFFTLDGDYHCSDVEDQVYLAATGGNPGLDPGTDNKALVMLTALGRCGDLPSTPFVTVNEMTTVAAVYALTPFITAIDQIGASSTNALGIRNGMLNAALLVSPYTGDLPTPDATREIETGKIAALANSIASCVNSDGGTGCTSLFTAATLPMGAAPTNTLQALLNIARNPANNVEGVFDAATPEAPFATSLDGFPHDWTISMTLTGGGLSAPTALAIDAKGNVWVADYPGAVSNFTPQGTATSVNGYKTAALAQIYGLTIDTTDHIWVANSETPVHGTTKGSVSKISGDSSATPGTVLGTFSDPNLDYPYALAADTNGNIMIANYNSGLASVYNKNGGVVSSKLGNGVIHGLPVAIAADSSHGVWLANSGNSTAAHVASDGTVEANSACCSTAEGIAVDATGNAWVANAGDDSVSEVGPTGTVVLNTGEVGGLLTPVGIIIDGGQDIWLANFAGNTISHVAGNNSTATAGAALTSVDGIGQDALMEQPSAIAVDPAGNVWVADYADDTVTMFFGLATPTLTPVGPVPAQP